jgi:hypothetical protein
MRNLGILLSGAVFLAAAMAAQSKYSGPRPPKPDVPYIVHAGTLVETEVTEAKEEERRDLKTYLLPTPSSPVRTPVPEPIFLLQSEKLSPDKLQLYKLEVKSGRREISFPTNPRRQKDAPQPIRLMVTRLEPGLFRLEVNHGMGLENGQYCMSPEGENRVFCFEEY